MTHPSVRSLLRAVAAGGALALALGLGACAGTSRGVAVQPAAGRSAPADPGASSDGPASDESAPSDGAAPPAAVGTPAASNRVTFVPGRVVLPGGDSAPVEPAATRDGELRVPENVQQVGWWDGSARAGDPFGNTVVAGHVDSASDGLGFFARLLSLKKGETLTLRGLDGHRLAYKITSIRTVKKNALATSGAAFDQTGDPHLVLITCGGAYRRGDGGYDSNVVVTAEPRGLAR